MKYLIVKEYDQFMFFQKNRFKVKYVCVLAKAYNNLSMYGIVYYVYVLSYVINIRLTLFTKNGTNTENLMLTHDGINLVTLHLTNIGK